MAPSAESRIASRCVTESALSILAITLGAAVPVRPAAGTEGMGEAGGAPERQQRGVPEALASPFFSVKPTHPPLLAR